MALVDWEAVVLDFEEYVRTRNSHGQRDLLAVLADLRVRHRQVEGLPVKALRLYGSELEEVLNHRAAARRDEDLVGMNGDSPHRSD